MASQSIPGHPSPRRTPRENRRGQRAASKSGKQRRAMVWRAIEEQLEGQGWEHVGEQGCDSATHLLWRGSFGQNGDRRGRGVRKLRGRPIDAFAGSTKGRHIIEAC